jgi:glycosyltransferase involved in cell wall biosynthesis
MNNRGGAMLVSILTPSFNQSEWLGDNLTSVACQTYPHIEHIVMDGGSTDGSVQLLKAAGRSVRWRSESDEGQAHAINKAFAASSGEIIGWINSDDAYFDCRVIEDVVAFFKTHPDVDVAYGHALQTTADGLAIQVLWAPRFDPALLGTVHFISQPATFIRRRALAEPMLDIEYHFGMDYELWLRLADQGRVFTRMNRITAIDRHQPERKSSTIKHVYRENQRMLAKRYDMRLGPEWEQTRTAFYIKQRLAGALLVPRLHRDVAFTAPERYTEGLLRRQLFTRKRDWPEEYR